MSGSQRQKGFTLVELMIALALGMLITLAVIQVFLASKTTYRTQSAQGLLQENGRFALGFISNEVRMAGYAGCANIERVKAGMIVASPPSDVLFALDKVIGGENDVGSAGGQYRAAPGTDTITVRKASPGVRLAGNMAANNANVQVVNNAPGFVRGDIAIISDCSAIDVFRITNNPGGSNGQQVTLTHANGANSSNRLSKVYGSDAEVMAFESIAYFVKATGRTTAGGAPINALWIRKRQAGSATAALQMYELVEGVENMQIEYGVDTNNDRRADIYRSASAISNWGRVVSAKISLLMQSLEDNVVASSGALSQTITFNGQAIPADGRMRKVFTNVVALRNRLP